MSNAHPSGSNIYFGGPDLNKNSLRDILLRSVEETPAGGSINWMCYYLSDTAILNALVEASRRNVTITILVDANPRVPDINEASINYLRKHASGSINLIIAHKKPVWEYLGINWHPHFHTKLYYFSDPTPHIFIGSYNPTAGTDELDDKTISEIGDHSISHNALARINNPELISVLSEYISNMHSRCFRSFARYSTSHNRTHSRGEWMFNYLPTLRAHPIQNLLTKNDKNAAIKCAISHLKGPGIRRSLVKALQLGKDVEILLDSTERRVPQEYLSFLKQHGIKYYQPNTPLNCLMHNKFILYDSPDESCVMFGSYNWSARSRYLNHEIVATTREKNIVSAFKSRWNEITANN